MNFLLSSKAVNHRIILRKSTQYVIPIYTKVTDWKIVIRLEHICRVEDCVYLIPPRNL
jgi:hypothetical protein